MENETIAKIRARSDNLITVQKVGPENFADLMPNQLRGIAMAYRHDVPALLAEIERLQTALQGTQNMLAIILQSFPNVREVCEQLVAEMGGADGDEGMEQ